LRRWNRSKSGQAQNPAANRPTTTSTTKAGTPSGPLPSRTAASDRYRWDEFVRSERVLPINDETKKQQAELRVKHHKERKRPVDKSDRPDTPAKTGHELPKGTKRTREERPPPDIKPSLNLDIPEYLRYLLVDDWEAITRNMQVRLAAACQDVAEQGVQLPPLPRQPTVKEIFAVYREETARHPRLKYANSRHARTG
jgi:mortality factor 4-like protein 1